jgi:hypothetical protein
MVALACLLTQGEPWLDTDGHVIDAHGGGMLEDAGTYYWYGSARQSCAKGGANRSRCGDRDAGVNLYMSNDLYNWKFVSTVVRAFNGSASDNGNDLERPKVVHCAGTGKFVMWVRGTGVGNTPQLLAVATSETPTGPFRFVGNQTNPFHTVFQGNRNLPVGYQYADATLFQDPKTNKTFVYWRTRVNPQNTGFRAMELTEDCLGVSSNCA